MKVAVVGSGPSGVGAATILIERGFEVDIFDGGGRHEAPADVLHGYAQAARENRYRPPPDKRQKGSPVFGDLLRRGASTLRLRKSILGSTFVFDNVDREIPMAGAWLPRSLAVGGLSNVWGTACYPLVATDYADWPVPEAEMAPWFDRAADLLGVSAEQDGLSDAYALYGRSSEVTGSRWQERQAGSGLEKLVQSWRSNPEKLKAAGVAAGRSRLAVSRADVPRDDTCVSCGSCMTGCPVGALWSSTKALGPLLASDLVTYRGGAIVDRIEASDAGETVWGRGAGGSEQAFGPYDAVVLAAGAVSTYLIARKSNSAEPPVARILDNDVYVLPLLLNRHHHRGEAAFALSEAAIALPNGDGRLAHLQLYRPSGPLLGPLKGLAARSQWLRRVLDRLTSRIVLGFLYLHSDQSREISVAVEPGADGAAALVVQPRDTSAAQAAGRRAIQKLWSVRRETGLTPLPLFNLRGDAGFSGHIGGTLPHRINPQAFESDSDGRIFPDRRVYAADLSVFPTMPAQNPTFIAVANAMRIASRI